MQRNAWHPAPETAARLRRMAAVCLLGGLAALALVPTVVRAQPITTDSRIKTFVFNPNEVYTITTHYGYQSNIEFGLKESIDTISVGDRVAWQIIPAGRRLFIRAMEENAHTNMTIVTNKRAYQFDLRSSSADAVFGSEELTYVVRFFYPQDPDANGPAMASASSYIPPSVNQPMPLMSPPVTTTTPAPMASAPSRTNNKPMNYRYTYSGPNDIAPTKIYDDGKTTYFKLPVGDMPKFAILTAKGESVSVATRRTDDGFVAVDAIAPRFSLNEAGRQVIVYNEAGGEVH